MISDLREYYEFEDQWNGGGRSLLRRIKKYYHRKMQMLKQPDVALYLYLLRVLAFAASVEKPLPGQKQYDF